MSRNYINLNSNWKFIPTKMPDDYVYRIEYDDSWWETVSIPHTLRYEPYNVILPLQGQCWYQKHIYIDKQLEGKKIYLEFEGAMQESDIYVNGKKNIYPLRRIPSFYC